MKYKYKAVIYPCEYGDGFLARIPNLPGCTVLKDTYKDALVSVKKRGKEFLICAENRDLPILPNDYEDEVGIRGKGIKYEIVDIILLN